jgi:hypothetical protein
VAIEALGLPHAPVISVGDQGAGRVRIEIDGGGPSRVDLGVGRPERGLPVIDVGLGNDRADRAFVTRRVRTLFDI